MVVAKKSHVASPQWRQLGEKSLVNQKAGIRQAHELSHVSRRLPRPCCYRRLLVKSCTRGNRKGTKSGTCQLQSSHHRWLLIVCYGKSERTDGGWCSWITARRWWQCMGCTDRWMSSLRFSATSWKLIWRPSDIYSGKISVLWRGEMKCVDPRVKDANLCCILGGLFSEGEATYVALRKKIINEGNPKGRWAGQSDVGWRSAGANQSQHSHVDDRGGVCADAMRSTQ